MEVKYKNKIITCKFFEVPCKGAALLELSDIELLRLLSIICNTMEAETKMNTIRIHQNKGIITHKPCPNLYITYWLSRQDCTENKDKK